MKKVVSKGYTIIVDSWENDGDNSKTKSITVESKEVAKAIYDMCNIVFKSSNNNEGGIGNLSEDEEKIAKKVILPFMKLVPELYDNKNLSDDKLVNICMDYNYKLMGGSEWYYSRICEKCTVLYSDKDIFLEQIF